MPKNDSSTELVNIFQTFDARSLEITFSPWLHSRVSRWNSRFVEKSIGIVTKGTKYSSVLWISKFPADKTTGASGTVVDSTPVSRHIQSAPLTAAFRYVVVSVWFTFQEKAQCRLNAGIQYPPFKFRTLSFQRYRDILSFAKRNAFLFAY